MHLPGTSKRGSGLGEATAKIPQTINFKYQHHEVPCHAVAEAERKKNLEACKRVAVLGILANLFLFVMQAITGLAGNSAGLIAKAVDSFGDLVCSPVPLLVLQPAAAQGYPLDCPQIGRGAWGEAVLTSFPA